MTDNISTESSLEISKDTFNIGKYELFDDPDLTDKQGPVSHVYRAIENPDGYVAIEVVDPGLSADDIKGIQYYWGKLSKEGVDVTVGYTPGNQKERNLYYRLYNKDEEFRL